MSFSKAGKTSALTLLLALMLACGGFCLALTSCGGEKDAGEGEVAEAAGETTVEEVVESFIPHGASYSKSETVAATTDLNGNLQDIAVTEWIKNPAGLETVSDVSTLNAISVDGEGVSFAQDGANITWSTGGQDVHYSGTTDAELPFGISYEYKLDGQAVEPSALKNAKGQLEVTIRYENKTSGQVYASGVSHEVQMPYVMASIIAFNPEHARNISVDNGTVIDMNGQQMAVGIGMPGLSKTLGIQDQVELPDSVTITADILGFDMPNITTMATAQGLEMIGGKVGEVEDGVAGLFSKTAAMQQGFTALSEGIKGMGVAAGQLKAAQEGLVQLNGAIQGMVTGASGYLANAESEQADAIGALDKLRKNLKCANASAAESTPCGSCENCVERASIDAALAKLKASQTHLSNAQTIISGAAPSTDDSANSGESPAIGGSSADTTSADATSAANPSTPNAGGEDTAPTTPKPGQTAAPNSVSAALTTLNTAANGIVTALDGLKMGMDKMGEATATMGEGISSMLSQAQSAIYSKANLVEALADYVENQGAFCGSASDMPASTTFTITAQAE